MVSSDRVVAFATFNGHGSDKMSWMSKDRLIESSWEDLSDYIAEEPVVVSLQGRYCWQSLFFHDDVIKLKHFPRYWPFATQAWVMRNFDAFFDLCLNKLLSTQSKRRWF